MSSRLTAPADHAIEPFLQHTVAEILGVPVGSITSRMTMSSLGLDSLGTLHLIESIESDLRRELPADVCFDQLTIGTLANVLTTLPAAAGTHSESQADQMLADSRLPEDIWPEGAFAATAPPQSILLTGATGFLGGFLLRSLLRFTNAQVLCLVRTNGKDGRSRIRQNLKKYGIWEDTYNKRIQTFEADLSQPRLGLSSVSFDKLAANADMVFHAGASVNWVQPYSRLRKPNVFAVRELLRLACRHTVKPFHFVSTLAVCYSTTGAREICEADDAFRDLIGIHLGYAQSKCVAESLARTAAGRGLPVSIFRPSLISGDSVSGISNMADFVSTFIKGCIAMGAAPDLDWRLDLVPVDYAANAIARLALNRKVESSGVFHLANPKLRHWRELILWMNLFGYRVDLLPYEEWLGRLEADARLSHHPLRDLLPFFRHRPEGQEGHYLPQLYEEPRRRQVHFIETRAALATYEPNCPELSAGVLDRYFSSFIDRKFLAKPDRTSIARPAAPELDANFFRSVTGNPRIVTATPVEFEGGHSIISELTSWRYGQSIGLHGYQLGFESESLDVVAKVKPRDTEIIEVGEAMAALCSPRLGQAYRRFSSLLGLDGCDVRELGVYSQTDDRFRRHSPAFYGGRCADAMTTLILERLSGMELMDSIDALDRWQPAHIEAAIEGMSEIHAIWYGQEARLIGQPWLKAFPSRSSMLESKELWTALAEHALPMFSPWVGAELGSIQRTLIESLDESWSLIEAMPRTLIHNDCNPRNLAFRSGAKRRLCLYDWELATLGLPQHDLAELLCFVLGPEPDRSEVLHYVELQRLALERATGQPIDGKSWFLGFCLSLDDLMVNRFPAYAMIHHLQRQSFLEPVIRTWMALARYTRGVPQ